MEVDVCSESFEYSCNFLKISGDTHRFARLAAVLIPHIAMTLRIRDVFSDPSIEVISKPQEQLNFSCSLLGYFHFGASLQALPQLSSPTTQSSISARP
jgi:hypothetical protein